MLPTLFSVGEWDVPTHEFFIGLGLVAALMVFAGRAHRAGRWSDQTRWIVVGALISGGIFARVAAFWQFAFTGSTFLDIWLYGGRSVLGGLAGAYVGVVVTKRLVGYRSSTGDLFAPAVAVGMAIGRVGCFLTEQIGTATSLPWGIRLAPDVAATVPNCPACTSGGAMHPSFLYEVAFHIAAFAVLVLGHKRIRPGASFKLYLLAYGLFRFAVEFVRGNPELLLGLSGSQAFLLLTIPPLALHVVRSSRGTAVRRPIEVPT